ncbi:cation diffusion facilitator family transporter [Gayadomonas joobiniege]|uniref:cation diffusion facilitator family transporter n=1 Tax=Gayadomonas joobiniege TaxID=1234606 RepID=UPI00035F3E2D|nr:cation diffusion facilitator family transporter [Gayadomonas joobiniege]
MHGHHHHHHNQSSDLSSQRIGWAFFLNLVFTIIEFIGGLITNSTAIMADAVHDLGDTLSIGSAWVLQKLGKRGATAEYTYGFLRLSLLGALINGVILLAGSIWVLMIAIPRLAEPVQPDAEGMFWLALLGVCVNGYAAYKLSSGKTLNEKVLNWHLIEDVLGWVAVLVVSVVLMFVNLPILDPLLSIGFTLFVLVGVARVLFKTLNLFLQAVPDPQIKRAAEDVFMKQAEVDDVHHLHLWSLDGEQHVLTAHLVLAEPLSSFDTMALKIRLADELAQFKLAHTTIEFEHPGETCRDKVDV